jgi:peptidoglycan/LPS O-acetylase OafA/YrhL
MTVGTNTAGSYLASLDVIRGIAVILVVIFHSGLLNSGWVGVPIFFTLSGFLITRGLLRSKSDVTTLCVFAFNFYRNRVLRIFPVYFGSIVVLGIISVIVDVPGYTKGIWVYLSTFTANFAVLAKGERLTGVVIHFWSLAVEEQFYLIWPFIVWKLPKLHLKSALWIIILLTPLGRYLLAQSLPDSLDEMTRGNILYVLPTSHLDSLSVGALLALAEQSNHLQQLIVMLMIATIAFIAAHLFTLWSYWQISFNHAFDLDMPEKLLSSGSHIWYLSIIATLCGFMISQCILHNFQAASLPGRCFRRLGKVSYSLYVLHVPVKVLVQSLIDILSLPGGRFSTLLIYAPLSYFLAELSYRWIESPFLKLKRNLSPPKG